MRKRGGVGKVGTLIRSRCGGGEGHGSEGKVKERGGGTRDYGLFFDFHGFHLRSFIVLLLIHSSLRPIHDYSELLMLCMSCLAYLYCHALIVAFCDFWTLRFQKFQRFLCSRSSCLHFAFSISLSTTPQH